MAIGYIRQFAWPTRSTR